MSLDTKQATHRWQPNSHHVSFGIQKWLCSRGYILQDGSKTKVDAAEYRNLLSEFILFDNPKFDFTKIKKDSKLMENYVQDRFGQFCGFCIKKFKV